MHTSLRTRHHVALWLLPLLALILCASFVATAWHHDDDSAAHPCAVCAVAHATWTAVEAPAIQSTPAPLITSLVATRHEQPFCIVTTPRSSRAPPA